MRAHITAFFKRLTLRARAMKPSKCRGLRCAVKPRHPTADRYYD